MFTNEFKVLGEKQLARVHALTLQVLREKGVVFFSEKALDIFKKHGFTVDGQCVKFSANQVEQAIKQCPSGFLWTARNAENSIYVGEGQKANKVYVMQNHGPVFVQNKDGSRRNGMMQDVINFYKLGQTSKVSSIVGQVSVDPSDFQGVDKQMRITHELLKNTDKPIMSFPATQYQDNLNVFNMLRMVVGQDYLKDHYCVTASVCALSPLQYAEESADCIIAYAENNQPVTLLNAPMMGVSTPITPMGSLICQNAEILAGLVLAQLVNPGNPVIYGTGCYISDMRNGAYVTSSPDANLVDRAAMQLAQTMYHLPIRTMAGNTDAKTPDIQAGYETFQNYITYMTGGTHMINECLGILDGMMAVSYEKYIIDEEVIERVNMIMQGLPTEEYDFDISSLLNLPHGSTFLMEDATLDACATQWHPSVSNWDSYDQYEADGCPNILDKAAKICEERLASASSDLLGDSLNKDINSYIEKLY